MARQLFDPDGFGPVLDPLDICMLYASDGPYLGSRAGGNATPFYEVQAIEPVPGIGGQHGILWLWTQSGSAPAGYAFPAGVTPASGTITAGSQVSFAPQVLQQAGGELLQFRYLLVQTGLTGPKMSDIDLQVAQPNSRKRWAVNGPTTDQGRWNVRWQFPMPGDVGAQPAQGADLTLPTLFPYINPWAKAHLTETFAFEDVAPTFQIWNYGAGSATAGSIGIAVMGFRYILSPMTNGPGWQRRMVMDREFQAAPPRFTPIQITGV